MKRGSIFQKILGYLICACLLTAVLSVAFYSFTGADLYARRIAEEMLPRTYGLARLAERYQTGAISFDSFIDVSLRDQEGCRVYIYDGTGQMIAFSSDTPLQDDPRLSECAQEVISTGTEYISAKWRSPLGIVVGVPIKDNMGRNSGVVLMTKPTHEVYDAIRGMLLALLYGSLAVSVLMILPAYYVSKRMTKPIRKMTDISIAMAGGDFSVRADENSNDEIGQLGHALNHLSARLDMNIRDLVLARNRLHVILDSLHEGVIALDGGEEIVYWNSSALQLLHCTDSSMLAGSLEPIMPAVRQTILQRRRQTVPLDKLESKLLLVISDSQENSETAPGAVIVVQDVTASERLEQTRRDYVANVSHELRTPIASIRSLAETLNDGLVKSEDDRFRYYGYILRESMRLSRLINDLLELSRLQSGAVALEKQLFNLNDLIREITERMKITASYSDITVENVLPADNGEKVFSNRDRIEQVLIALVDKAIKFATDDGYVRIETEEQESMICVTVRNSGHIAAKDLPHLFERFYKADASHSEGGTGLGLAIVQEVLNLLGETIEAANEEDSALFRFTVHKAE